MVKVLVYAVCYLSLYLETSDLGERLVFFLSRLAVCVNKFKLALSHVKRVAICCSLSGL